MPSHHRGVSRPTLAQRGSDATPLQLAARIAAGQRGLATRRQLLASGASAAAIDRSLRAGTLIRVHAGVYAVGHGALQQEAVWLAAVLAGGRGAVLSHRSAADAWGLLADARRAVDITVRNRTGFGQAGLTPHECRLTEADVTTHRGIPITTPARTLLDLAEAVPYRRFRQAAEASLHRRLFDAGDVGRVLERGRGRRGLKPLRRFLAEAVDEPATKRSELEILAGELVESQALPRAAANAWVLGVEVDLLWPTARVVVELDSWRHHGDRLSFERDRARDARLQAEGYAVLRFTWRQVTEDRAVVADRIRAVLAGRVASDPR
jgi:hypothetical protein